MHGGGYGNITVITDGQCMDSYEKESPVELSQEHFTSRALEDMWFNIDLESEHVICAEIYRLDCTIPMN